MATQVKEPDDAQAARVAKQAADDAAAEAKALADQLGAKEAEAGRLRVEAARLADAAERQP